MPRFRTAVLGVLVSAAVSVGSAPAAGAAPQVSATGSLSWQLWGGSTLMRGQSVNVCTDTLADEWLLPGQTVTLQVLLGGSWVTKRTVTVDDEPWQSCIAVTPSDLVAKPGRYSFRALTRPTPESAVVEGRTALTLTRLDGYAAPHQSEYFTTTTATGRSLVIDVSPALGQSVELQRKAGSRWLTVSRAKAPTTARWEATVRLSVPKRAGHGVYRIVDRATTWSSQSISPKVVVHQTDTVRYRSYLVKARKIVARYCPKTPIHIDTVGVARATAGRVYGQAHGSWTGDNRGGSLTTMIALRSGMTGMQLKHVALHECAHVVQFRAHVEGKRELEQKRARNLWRYVGDEGQADCMAYVITRSTRSFGYVRGCTKMQVANARRMWHAYGKKYQAATYRWQR